MLALFLCTNATIGSFLSLFLLNFSDRSWYLFIKLIVILREFESRFIANNFQNHDISLFEF